MDVDTYFPSYFVAQLGGWDTTSMATRLHKTLTTPKTPGILKTPKTPGKQSFEKKLCPTNNKVVSILTLIRV